LKKGYERKRGKREKARERENKESGREYKREKGKK
jgi:hypothetical protein